MLTDYDTDMKECHCYATSRFDAGEQVLICYGVRPNADFFVHNGFVYPDNPHDAMQLKLGPFLFL